MRACWTQLKPWARMGAAWIVECALSSPVVIERSRPAPLVEDGAAHAPASKVITDKAAS